MTWQQQVEEYKMQRNMDNCGVHWFKFDEASGNVSDSKGNAVGSTFGATRVTGLNGTGKALSFNGTSNYIQFNSPVFPIGKKIIKFKVSSNNKPSSAYTIAGNSGGSVQHGDIISINSDGSLQWQSTRAISGNVRFNVVAPINICNGIAHDILLEWDGTTNVGCVKIYVDDMNTPKATGTANSTESVVASNNLTFGKFPTNSSYYFNGILDNFQVYNDKLILTINKLLLKNNTSYIYYGDRGELNILPNEPTVQDLLDFGMDDITVVQLQDFESIYGKQYRILHWTDGVQARKAKLKAIPQPELVLPNGEISIFGVETIDKLELTANGNVKMAISFDNEVTWQAHDGTNWNVVNDASIGMDVTTFSALTAQQLNEIRNESTFIRFSYYLDGKEAEIDLLKMTVSMKGHEQPANRSDWSYTYDQSTKTLIYNITKSGTYTIKYLDA